MSSAPHLTIVKPIIEMDSTKPGAIIQLEYLRNRVATLENQLERAIAHSRKKEAYATTLESDLEHIITQLQRLEVVK